MSVLDVLGARPAGVRPRGTRLGTVALVGPAWSATWPELDARVVERAEELRESGLTNGAVHPLVVEADPEGVVELLAAWRAGAVPAPLNARLTEGEQARARHVLREAPDRCQAVLWTSGTAGRPRGVALGSDGLLAHVEAVAERLDLDGSEVWLASLSPAHVGGLALIARAVLTGAALVAHGPLDTETLARLLRGSPPVTHLSLVPTQLDRLVERWGPEGPPPELRCVLVGGAHAPPDLVGRALAAGWPIALTYGMTEMWSQVATAPPAQTRQRPDTVGRLLEGVEIRIDSEQEILVRGPTRALGYIEDGPGPAAPPDAPATPPEAPATPPDAPALALPADRVATPLADEEGWYRTGDLGELDPDGCLRITGRRSDRIISGGVNVDPLEVEDALRQHPSVIDVAVVGVPSREWGETVGAVVVPVWGEFELSEVEAFLRSRLGGAKRPRAWKMEAKLPRNVNGKVDRAAVRALFTNP